MAYDRTAAMVPDLERRGELLRFDLPIRAELELSAVLRRVYAARGPAVLFTRVEGSPFPVLGNLYGTPERARFLLRHGQGRVEKVMRLKADPGLALRRPWEFAELALSLPHLWPRSGGRAPVLARRTRLDLLPQQIGWPGDGGAFVTLPAVYTEDPARPGRRHGNLGMYRVQISGNDYLPGEAGLHYQIHRGIGVHHQAALARGQRLWVNVFVGGPPALTWAAVMPLPEEIPELVFAGALGNRAIRLARCPESPLPLAAEADFVLVGYVEPGQLKPEGPFGDHLGYYSLRHPYPVLQVTAVYHRSDAIWPVTTVGRPPQEDTTFGELIHHWTGPVLPSVLPGVRQIHAVDAAGVHPLLLALASERYTPYQDERRPQELLTAAQAILGQGQLSLAKYLFIADAGDAPGLDCSDVAGFLRHMLERVDPRRDLHFHTETTIDTLDYSGSGLNRGSKLVLAARGPARRELPRELPAEFRLPPGFGAPALALPGVLVLQGPAYAFDPERGQDPALDPLQALPPDHPLNAFPLWVLVDDSGFAARNLANFLWVAFTRSNPAADTYGVGARTYQKHWGCAGALILDARPKPHHAPSLEEDSEVMRRVESWAAPGGPLHRIV